MLLVLAYSSAAVAADRGFANYDGDTLRATFRIENIDTPEIKGACDAERKLAVRAKDFTAAWLANGRVTIKQTGIDQYGRVLARVSRDPTGDDLGEALVGATLEGAARELVLILKRLGRLGEYLPLESLHG